VPSGGQKEGKTPPEGKITLAPNLATRPNVILDGMQTVRKLPTYPVKRFTVPRELKKYENGKIPVLRLWPIKGGGRLYRPAANDWNAMCDAAKVAGFTIKNVSSGYRSYQRQVEMFLERYSPIRTARRPEVTRIWNGKKYWLKVGKSPSATPQKSVHGWACAQDTNVSDPRLFSWLVANAPKYNFYWQGQKYRSDGTLNPEWEPWHLQWVPK
jgi:hypothetical protein